MRINEATCQSLCETTDIGQQIAKLAKSRGISQGALAEKIEISRVSVNRFFKGKSSIRAKDLVLLLKVLDINLEDLIQEKVECNFEDESGGIGSTQSEVYADMISIIESLDSKAKSSVMEQIVWWGRCVMNEQARSASDRLFARMNTEMAAG